MKSLQLVVLMFLTLVATVAVIFQFFESEAEEINGLSDTTQQVLHVKQIDIKLNEVALKAASFKLVQFDAIVKTVNELSTSLEALSAGVLNLQEQVNSALDQQIDGLSKVILHRIQTVEKLTSKVAIARNSSSFLLSSLGEQAHLYGIAVSPLALQALNAVQGYQAFPTPEHYEITHNILKRLEEEIQGKSNMQNVVLRHMHLSLEATQDISKFLKVLFVADSQDRVDLLLKTLHDIQNKRQNNSNRFRYVLLSVAIVILLALAYSMVRWNQARNKSLQTSQLFKGAVESIAEGFAFFGPDDRLVFSNSTFKEMYHALGDKITKGTSLTDFEAAQAGGNVLIQSILQADGSHLEEHKGGRWLLSSNTKMEHGGHALVRIDLTEQKRIEEELSLSATVFQAAGEAMMVTDPQDRIQMVNPAFTTITGYAEDEVIGKTPEILNSGRHDHDFFRMMFQNLTKTGIWQGEIWNRRKNGEIFPEWLSITTIYDDEGEVKQRIGLFTDITSRKKSEERIHYQANYDSLTDLPNRNLFQDRLYQSINQARRGQKRIALLSMDLDNFKHINDTLGHLSGDGLLREIASRLRAFFRSSDTIARLSGDEFIIIFNDAAHNADLEQLLERLLKRLSEPYTISSKTVYTSVSIGVTFFPDDGNTVDTLLQNADAAMFKAKERGRNTYCFFTSEMNTRAQERHDLEIALHGALENSHFVLHYQPIIDPVSETVISTEALVRWVDPERGLIGPDKFIPVAEDTGLIVEMGKWILLQACRDAANWYHNEGIHVGVSVNLSSRQFKRSDILQLVKDALAETGLPAQKLTLEITESLLVDDDSDVLQTLRAVRDLGVLLSIDDFGTGYSSLSYLKRFPITTLKIDRSFINGVLSNSEDAALTQAILSMAQGLNLKVIAEGVENAGQVAFLLERQCHMIQGFHYSRPLPVEKLLADFGDRKLVV